MSISQKYLDVRFFFSLSSHHFITAAIFSMRILCLVPAIVWWIKKNRTHIYNRSSTWMTKKIYIWQNVSRTSIMESIPQNKTMSMVAQHHTTTVYMVIRTPTYLLISLRPFMFVFVLFFFHSSSFFSFSCCSTLSTSIYTHTLSESKAFGISEFMRDATCISYGHHSLIAIIIRLYNRSTWLQYMNNRMGLLNLVCMYICIIRCNDWVNYGVLNSVSVEWRLQFYLFIYFNKKTCMGQSVFMSQIPKMLVSGDIKHTVSVGRLVVQYERYGCVWKKHIYSVCKPSQPTD